MDCKLSLVVVIVGAIAIYTAVAPLFVHLFHGLHAAGF